MTREEQINAVAVSNGLEFRNNLIKESVSEDIARMYSNIAITYFEKGAKYADRTMLDKACEWLLNHNDYQRVLDNGCSIRFDMTQCVMDFRKAMEEQQ